MNQPDVLIFQLPGTYLVHLHSVESRRIGYTLFPMHTVLWLDEHQSFQISDENLVKAIARCEREGMGVTLDTCRVESDGNGNYCAFAPSFTDEVYRVYPDGIVAIEEVGKY